MVAAGAAALQVVAAVGSSSNEASAWGIASVYFVPLDAGKEVSGAAG